MIGIEVNGIFLEINEDSFRFEKINTSFYPEVFQGDYSFPLTIDDTEINRKALGFPNSLEIGNRVLNVECYLWISGLPYSKSRLYVIGGSKNKIKINIAGGLKSVSIFEKSLKQLDYGTPHDLGVDSDGPHVQTDTNLVPPASNDADFNQTDSLHSAEEMTE